MRKEARTALIFLPLAALLASLATYLVRLGPSVGSEGHARDKTVRFRVVARSDDPGDQAAKIIVRDAVLPIVTGISASSRTPDEVLEMAVSRENEIITASQRVLYAHGIHYPVRVQANAVDRKLELILGEGRGHNWWCVLFPPICLVEPVANRSGNKGGEPGNVSKSPPRVEIRSVILDWFH